MSQSDIQRRSKLGVILLAYIAFISLGLPDGLMGVAWPSIRAFFGRPLDSLGILLFAGTAGYLTSSFFSGRIMARLGVGGLLAASCAIGIPMDLETYGKVRLARGFTSSTYTVSSFTAYWMFMRPLTRSALPMPSPPASSSPA